MKSRFLNESEKRDVVVAVMEFLKKQNPCCTVHVEVADWTDERGLTGVSVARHESRKPVRSRTDSRVLTTT